jgi:Uma2 family endonuclease
VGALFAAWMASKGLISAPDGRNPGVVGPCYASLQMATKSQITAEQYLAMAFEYEPEYVRGEIVERAMPTYFHGRIQAVLLSMLCSLPSSHRLYGCAAVRMKLAPDLYRIPDIAAFLTPQDRAVPQEPPLVVIEILSPDDRHHDLMEKLEEYRVWDVPNIWVIDPLSKRLSLYTASGLQTVSSLALADYPFELTPAALFSDL